MGRRRIIPDFWTDVEIARCVEYMHVQEQTTLSQM